MRFDEYYLHILKQNDVMPMPLQDLLQIGDMLSYVGGCGVEITEKNSSRVINEFDSNSSELMGIWRGPLLTTIWDYKDGLQNIKFLIEDGDIITTKSGFRYIYHESDFELIYFSNLKLYDYRPHLKLDINLYDNELCNYNDCNLLIPETRYNVVKIVNKDHRIKWIEGGRAN